MKLMSNVLVTAGAGFIGSSSVDMLVEEGCYASLIDNFERCVHRE
jgi:UDP-glucose 4-epimerase